MDFLSFTDRKKPVAATREKAFERGGAPAKRKTFIPQIPDKRAARAYTKRIVYMSNALHEKLGQPFYGTLALQPTIGAGRCLSFSNNEVFFLYHCGGQGDFSLMARSFNEQEEAWVYVVAYEKHYDHKILFSAVADNGRVLLVAEQGRNAIRLDLLDKRGASIFHQRLGISGPFEVSGNESSTRFVIDEYRREEGYKSSHTLHALTAAETPSLRTVQVEGLAYHEAVVKDDFFTLEYQNKEEGLVKKKPNFMHILDEKGNHWNRLPYRKYIETYAPASQQLALYKKTYISREERLSHPPYLNFLLGLEKKIEQQRLYEELGAYYLHHQDPEKTLDYWARALKMEANESLRTKYEALRKERTTPDQQKERTSSRLTS